MARSNRGDDAPFVFSTQFGELCPRCDQPKRACTCGRTQKSSGAGGGPGGGHGGQTGAAVVRVGRETKGRRGKGVTTITGIPLEGEALRDLAKELKRACGSGGALKDGVLEIQGEHRDRLVKVLGARGWQVKRSGG